LSKTKAGAAGCGGQSQLLAGNGHLAPLAYSIFQLSIIIAKKVSFASPYLYSKWQNKYNPGFTRAKK
jgi:hypothetical protein